MFSFPHDFTAISNEFANQFCKAVNKRQTSILIQCVNLKKNLPNFQVNFKFRENVFQDMMVFKLISLFDKWWMEKGLDLKMTNIKITPTHDMMGFSQVVENAESLQNIIEKYGNGITQYDKFSITKYLETHNKVVAAHQGNSQGPRHRELHQKRRGLLCGHLCHRLRGEKPRQLAHH